MPFRIVKIRIAAILWILLILFLSFIPGDQLPRIDNVLSLFAPDKIIHLFLFAVLSVLLFQGFIRQYRNRKSRYIYSIILIVVLIALAGFTEIMQSHPLISRNASIFDFIADITGGILSFGILIHAQKKKEKNLKTFEKF